MKTYTRQELDECRRLLTKLYYLLDRSATNTEKITTQAVWLLEFWKTSLPRWSIEQLRDQIIKGAQNKAFQFIRVDEMATYLISKYSLLTKHKKTPSGSDVDRPQIEADFIYELIQRIIKRKLWSESRTAMDLSLFALVADCQKPLIGNELYSQICQARHKLKEKQSGPPSFLPSKHIREINLGQAESLDPDSLNYIRLCNKAMEIFFRNESESIQLYNYRLKSQGFPPIALGKVT